MDWGCDITQPTLSMSKKLKDRLRAWSHAITYSAKSRNLSFDFLTYLYLFKFVPVKTRAAASESDKSIIEMW